MSGNEVNEEQLRQALLKSVPLEVSTSPNEVILLAPFQAFQRVDPRVPLPPGNETSAIEVSDT